MKKNNYKNNYNKKLDLKDDLVFQKIFGSPENSEITSHFLSLILKRDINNINLDANKNLLGEYIDGKNSALDVRAIINDGEDVDLEMQARKFNGMANRMAFYTSKNAYS